MTEIDELKLQIRDLKDTIDKKPYCDEHSGHCAKIKSVRYLAIAGITIVLIIIGVVFTWSQSEHSKIHHEHHGRFEKMEEAMARQQAIQTDVNWIKEKMKDMDSKFNYRSDETNKHIKELIREIRKNNNGG